MVSVERDLVPSHPLSESDLCSRGSSPARPRPPVADNQDSEVYVDLSLDPSDKEVAAATAARARLYGEVPGNKLHNQDRNVILPSGPEPEPVDVQYLSRSEVMPVVGGDFAADLLIKNCIDGLQSKNWPETVKALNQLRQLSVHHASKLKDKMHDVVPLVLKHVKSLRSSVCKTSLLCLSDLFHDLGDGLLPLLDVGGMEQPQTSLLNQVLLKASSNDKRFVIEEAERCLNQLCQQLDPGELRGMLSPYLQHRNPKVRGNAAECLATTLERLSWQELAAAPGGLGVLIRAAGSLVTDKTPQAREAARKIIASTHTAFCRSGEEGTHRPAEPAQEGSEQPQAVTSWDAFCAEELDPTTAAVVLRVKS